MLKFKKVEKTYAGYSASTEAQNVYLIRENTGDFSTFVHYQLLWNLPPPEPQTEIDDQGNTVITDDFQDHKNWSIIQKSGFIKDGKYVCDRKAFTLQAHSEENGKRLLIASLIGDERNGYKKDESIYTDDDVHYLGESSDSKGSFGFQMLGNNKQA